MGKDLEKITKHHIIPKSRGGARRGSNVSYVEDSRHRKYHELFFNKTPEEIVDYLNDYFWNGNYDIKMEEIR